MTIPLAESELQEISDAYENAEIKLKEAGAALEELVSVLKKRSAFVSNNRINKIRSWHTPVGNAIWQLTVQRCVMLRFGAARALR